MGRIGRLGITTLSSSALALAVACGDAARGVDDAGGTNADAAGDAAAAPDASPASLVPIIGFDAAKYELAEGLAVRGGKAYVGLAPLGAVLEVDPTGTSKPYGSVPAGYDKGYTLGLAFGGDGALFVAQTVNVPDAGAPAAGVYKIPPGGGAATTPFATSAEMVFPNGIALDAKGGLFVTDSATGLVFGVTAAGVVSKWKADPKLSGSPACPAPLPFPIGANGIVATSTAVFVTNTAKGSLLKIPVHPDGSAGDVEVLLEDCAYVGLDGLARDGDAFLVAQNGLPGRLLRVDAGGKVAVAYAGALLDGPASVAIDVWQGRRAALVTSSAFFSVGADGGAPRPGLAAYAPLP